MDPTALLLPRLRDSEESFSGTPIEVQQVTKALALRRSLFGTEDMRFVTYCQEVIADILQRKGEVRLLEAVSELLEDLPLSVLSMERSELYNALSQAYRQRNRPSLAHKYASKSLALAEHSSDPRLNRPSAYLHYSGLLTNIGRHKEAVEQARQAVEQLQEELVTFKLKKQGGRAAGKVAELVRGYRSLGTALESVQGYGEAAGWYGKAVKLAKESGDTELELQASALHTAQETALRKAEGQKPHFRPKSSVKPTRRQTSSLASPVPYRPNTDFSGSLVSSVGSSFLLSNGLATHEGLDSSLLSGGQEGSKEEVFLWRRDWQDTDQSEFARDTAERELPRLLHSGHPELSSQSSVQSKSLCSDQNSSRKSPLRLRRLRSESRDSQNASSRSGTMTALMKTVHDEAGKGVALAFKAKLARKGVEKRQKESETRNTEISPKAYFSSPISPQFPKSTPPSLDKFATKIQSAFRSLQARKLLKALQTRAARQAQRQLVIRTGKVTSGGLTVISGYSEGPGELLFIAKGGKGEDLRLEVKGEEAASLAERLEVVQGRLVLGGSEPQGPEAAPLPPDKPSTARIPPPTPTELTVFTLVHTHIHYQVSVLLQEDWVEVLPTAQPECLLRPSRTPLLALQQHLGAFEASQLREFLWIRDWVLVFHYERPVAVARRSLGKNWDCEVRVFAVSTGLVMQLIACSEVGILEITQGEVGVLLGRSENLSKKEYLRIISAVFLDNKGVFRLFLPNMREFQGLAKVQALIRRFLAIKQANRLRIQQQRRTQLLSRSFLPINGQFLPVALLKSPTGLLVRVSAAGKEQELLVKPDIWRQWGSSELTAKEGVLSNLTFKAGQLVLTAKPRDTEKRAERVYDEEKVVRIQKWTRGRLARTAVWKADSTLVLCKQGQWGWGAVYQVRDRVRIELFPTEKHARTKAKSTYLQLHIEEIRELYGCFPAYEALLNDLDLSTGVPMLQLQKPAYLPQPPSLVLTTPKTFAQQTLLIQVYFHSDPRENMLEFRCETALSVQAPVFLLSTHCRLPPDQLFVLALATIRYFLSLRNQALVLTYERRAPDLVRAVTRLQAQVRGFLVRSLRTSFVTFNSFNLVACTHRRFNGRIYALYAYFQDSCYKVEAISKFPRERLLLFLDESVFYRFGPNINRKKVFEELVFPILDTQITEKCMRLCINPAFLVSQDRVKDYIRPPSAAKIVSPILRRKVKPGLKDKATISTPKSSTRRKNQPMRVEELEVEPTQPHFSPISPPSSETGAEEPLPDSTILSQGETSSANRRTGLGNSVIERMPGLVIDPISPSKSTLCEIQPVQQGVFPPLEDAKSADAPVDTEKNAPSPRVIDLERYNKRYPKLRIKETAAEERDKQLVARVGMDFTVGFCTISVYLLAEGLEVEAVCLSTYETAVATTEFSSTAGDIEAYCDQLLAFIDVFRSDSGQLLLLTPGSSPLGTALYFAPHLLSSRLLQVTISCESHTLIVRAFDPVAKKTFELALGHRTRSVQDITPLELQALAERLQVQTLLGREMLIIEAA